MNRINIKQLAIYVPAVLIIFILAIIPLHAFLTVWASSLLGHYTAIRLWKEYLVLICLIGALYIFLSDKPTRQLFYKYRLVQLMLVFFVVELIWGLVAHDKGNVNTKALLYGWLSDCRYFVFFIVTLIIASKTNILKNKAIKLVIWPAAIVILFGLLEIFVLPRNFLSHFGYGPRTIPAYQTINNNNHLIRIASTLRGANPLGAYLTIPLTLAIVLIARKRKVWQLTALFIGGLVVMVFSFSRSAWLGLVVSLVIAIYFGVSSAHLRRRLLYVALAFIVVLAGVYVAERNNSHIQNIVFHYQKNSTSKTSSDQNHTSALKDGLKQVLTEPLGKGPGSAGPASVYNNHATRITENYYIQIGQETGCLGLAIFLAINVLIVISLWVRRQDTLCLALLASFIGLIVCNTLLEAWTDDTLCYVWWGLAGIAIAIKPKLVAKSKTSWIL